MEKKMSDNVPKRELEWWEHYPLHKLWCNDACPLVPRFHYRKGDEWNANGWQLHWLIFNIWTLEHFAFGLDAEVAPDGIYIGTILPYLRVIVGVRHTYYEWQYKLSRLLRRKPAEMNHNGEYN
jgi:hypothetical protein